MIFLKSEQAIERYLCRRVKENGGMCIKLVGYNGIPDRLVILPYGGCIFIELKADGGHLSPIQIAVQRHLNALQQVVYTLWSCEQVDEFISDYFKEWFLCM